MPSSIKTEAEKQELNDRLKSLRINRGPTPSQSAPGRVPKKLLLAFATLVALLAVGYAYFFAATKTISVGEVKTESGASSGGTVLAVSGDRKSVV